MKTFFLFFLLSIIGFNSSHGQVNTDDFNKSNFLVDGKQIDYLAFGGTGEPLIWVMDLHNYFNGSDEGKIWIEHLKSLSENFDVYALIRPGYTDVEFDKSVFGVSEQSAYLNSFIEHLGNDKVFLYSKFPGNQDLIYMVENNPEKVKGIIFQGSHLLYPKSQNLVIKEFLKHFYAGSCDLTDLADDIVNPRIEYLPDFINTDISIQIPLLILRLPGYDDRNIFLGYLDNIESVSKYHFCENIEAQNYFKNLADSPEVLQQIKQNIVDSDRTDEIMERIEKTFGKYLTVKNLDLSKDIFKQSEVMIKEFKNKTN